MRAYGKITVVGLGSGHVEQMTLGVWRRIKHANHIYLRTAEHPIVTVLDEEQIRYESFDEVYRSHVDFASVYESITEMLIAEAVAGKDVLYGVPGHPAVAEQTVRLLRRRCRSQAIVYEEFGGESFLDQAYTKLGIDPIDGFQLYDASSFRREHIQPDVHTFITQVYDMITASDVKLTLMDVYPDEHVVTVAHRLGFADERIKQVPLYELDRLNDYGNWSFIWIPRSTDDSLKRRSFSRLHDIVHRLRSPDGCPWDREQTHQSIRKNLIEEMYEVLEAIDHDDHEALCEELGDVLLQVMLHSQMEAEMGTFTVYDVIQTLNDKLIRRHPHVFGDEKANSSSEALANWEKMKEEEQKRTGEPLQQRSILTGIPKDLPALMRAWELQKRTAKVGFDWPHIDDVLAKVEEELAEFREALGESDARCEEELGDLIFSVVNVARKQKIDPDYALSRTNKKFQNRFTYIEDTLRTIGKSLSKTSLQEMDQYWEEAKKV